VKNKTTARTRKCGEDTFDVTLPPHNRRPFEIDKGSLSYPFCPGKATWYAEYAELFEQCRVALEAGIMPKAGSLEDQDDLFVEAFPAFVERWRERSYQRMWRDVVEHTQKTLEAIFGKKK
jgi:hypothetical protein